MKTIYTLTVCACFAGSVMIATHYLPVVRAQQSDARPSAAQQKSDAQDDEKSQLSVFMRRKLEASNQILEGLVIDDMTKVNLGANRLLEMSKAERWRASNDMMYMHHSREFRRSVETMQEKANKKSIDGAALAWIDVTMSCIRCHEWVRDTMMADLSSIRQLNFPAADLLREQIEGSSR